MNKRDNTDRKRAKYHWPNISSSAILIALVTFVGALYISGSFAPDTLLLEKLRILNTGIEKKKIEIELKKLETEERISNKRIEIDKNLQFADASTKKEEAKLRYRTTELELKVKKELAAIERLTSMVRSCVDATTPGEIIKPEPSSYGGERSFHVVNKAQDGTVILNNCLKQYYKEFGGGNRGNKGRVEDRLRHH